MSVWARRFPPFSYNSLASTKKHICAHVLTCPYPIDSHTLPSLSLSVARFKPVVASLTTFWPDQLLVFRFTIVVSSYSNSYELMTVIAVVICYLQTVISKNSQNFLFINREINIFKWKLYALYCLFLPILFCPPPTANLSSISCSPPTEREMGNNVSKST
ncbi:hypothetical protein ACTXT7_016799 [Hymenolepis weldensis]